MRRKGHLNVGYIDDSYLQGDTVSECNENTTDTIDLFTRLGFIIHPIKSVLQPTQILIFLGFVLNLVNMTVSLTPEKTKRINDKCFELLSEVNMTIHDLAEVIGPGLLILRDGAISHNRPQIASDRTIHQKSRNSPKNAYNSQN